MENQNGSREGEERQSRTPVQLQHHPEEKIMVGSNKAEGIKGGRSNQFE